MPYDEVSVRLHIDRMFRKGIDLRCELFLKNGTALGRKLAVARLALAWVSRQRDAALQAEPVPVAVLDGIAAKISGQSPQVIKDKNYAGAK
jgi:acyl-CoA thioesterase FadM